MVPFSIHCTTCRAALRVTDAAAVGQILPCPKCGSMVQVVPPILDEVAIAAAGSRATSTAVAQPTFDLPSVAQTDVERIGAGGAKIQVQRPPEGRATPPPLPEVAAAMPPPASGSIAAKSWLPFAAAAAAVISLVTIGWGIASYVGDRSPDASVARSRDELTATADQDANAAGTSIAQPVDQQTSADAPTANPRDGDIHGGEPVGTAAPAPNELSATNGIAIPQDAQPAEPLPVEQFPHIDGVVVDVDQTQTATPGQTTSDASPANEERSARKPSLNLEDLPQRPSHGGDSDDIPSTASPSTARSLDLDEPAEPQPDRDHIPDAAHDIAQPPLARIAPPQVDVPARLAMNLAAVEFREAPLNRLLQTISELAGVTISLDADATRAAGIQIDEAVTVVGTSLTVQTLLEQSLRPLGLQAYERRGQLLVAPTSTSPAWKARYAVEDLVRPRDPSIDELADMVRTLIARRPDAADGRAMPNGKASFELSTSEGAIFLTGREIDHDRMIELCEKLRVARGRPLRSRFHAERPDPRFDPRRFELATRRSKAKELLKRPVTAGIGRPAPLCAVIAYLAEQSGGTILIDGPGLAATGLAVETESRLAAAGEPLEEALAKLLEPLELAYRVVDEKLLEVTTPQAAAERFCIEFYPVRALSQDAADGVAVYREKLLAAAGIDGSSTAVVFDPPSGCLIVSASYPDQVRLERALRAADRP